MDVKIVSVPGDWDWQRVCRHALATVVSDPIGYHVPSDDWKRNLLDSEHSPIRDLWYTWEWVDIPYWVSVHFVRHSIGITHFVQSQRNDRQSRYDRDEAKQSVPVNHRCVANAQALINISRVRLCSMASEETRGAWRLFLDALEDYDPIIGDYCVPNCVYRSGLCGEFNSCGYNKSAGFAFAFDKYRSVIHG